MFFKRKCRNCGATNPKDSPACSNCGTVFFSQQIEDELKRRKGPSTPVPMKMKEEKAEGDMGYGDILNRLMQTLGSSDAELEEEETECTCMECGAVFPVGDEEKVACPKCGTMLDIEEEEQ